MAKNFDIDKHFSFLNRGGKVGALIREYDWAKTPLGTPDSWSPTLVSSLSLMLHSRLPMLLFWGDDYTQLYNDAFIPCLGEDGQHPSAFGKGGEISWGDSWDCFDPIFQQIKQAKEGVYKTDQLVPIKRNGELEDVYWNFDYSPLFDDTENVAGILVICMETTEKVAYREAQEETQKRFRVLGDNIPNLAFMCDPNGDVNWYNKKWYEYTGTDFEIMKGWGWQMVMHPDHLPVILDKWRNSLKNKKPFDMVFPLKSKSGEYRTFLTRVLPVFEEGEIWQWFGSNTDISELLKVKDKLSESEERFQVMAENTDILIAVGDESGQASYFNKAWTDMTGRPMEVLLKFGWVDLVHEDDREEFLHIYLSAFEKRESFSGEFRVLDKYGNYRWVLTKGPALFNSDGTFAGYISTSVDITDRKEYEKKLQESEQQIRSVVESAPFPIGVYIGRDMRIQIANQSLMDIWSKGNDVVGKTYHEILPELANQKIYKQLDDVFMTGKPFHARDKRVDILRDGKLQPFYFNYSFTPLRDTEGNVYGVMNTAADITDLHLAKLKVQESERNLRETILQAPVAMCIFRGPKYTVELANEKMFEIMGKSQDQIQGKPVFEALPEAKDQGFEDLLEGVYISGIPFSAENVPVTLPRGEKIETVYVNFVYSPYREVSGDITGILAVAVDVTDQVLSRNKIEEVVEARTKELASLNLSLQKSNSELAQFAYVASHDLQEPLRKISTFGLMLKDEISDKVSDKAILYLEKIHNSSMRMSKLIRDVLTYSEVGSDNKGFSEVNLDSLVQEILSDYEWKINKKKADVQLGHLPKLEASPLQMQQLFSNLVSNALKYAHTGRPLIVKIGVVDMTDEEKKNEHVRKGVDYVKIQVRDTGIGFKEEYKNRIFNIFQRLHLKSEYEGTGIGLAICNKIVENHQGWIHADGSTEEGAVFNVILPRRQG